MFKIGWTLCFSFISLIPYSAISTSNDLPTKPTKYAFITNKGNYTVSACPINADGNFETCIVNLIGSSTSNTLQGIAIDKSGMTYIPATNSNGFVINYGSITGSNISNVAVANGGIGQVVSATILDKYFYAVNNSEKNISVCQVSSSGPTNCTSTDPILTNPTAGVAFYSSGGQSYAYITNQNNITRCQFSAEKGVFTDCQLLTYPNNMSSPALANPTGIVVNHNFVYIANQSESSAYILVCPFSSTGTLSSCGSFTHAGMTPMGLGVYNEHLYINNFTANTVTICRIDENGSLSFPCHINTDTSFNGPAGNIAFSE